MRRGHYFLKRLRNLTNTNGEKTYERILAYVEISFSTGLSNIHISKKPEPIVRRQYMTNADRHSI